MKAQNLACRRFTRLWDLRYRLLVADSSWKVNGTGNMDHVDINTCLSQRRSYSARDSTPPALLMKPTRHHLTYAAEPG